MFRRARKDKRLRSTPNHFCLLPFAFGLLPSSGSWVPHPAPPYMLLAAGLGMCLYLFWTLKREIGGLERRSNQRFQELDKRIENLRRATEEVGAGLQEAEERAGMLVVPTPAKSGLNVSKRSQVLRMFRLGNVPEKIATVLALPQNEVDLLLKVHRWSLYISLRSCFVFPQVICAQLCRSGSLFY